MTWIQQQPTTWSKAEREEIERNLKTAFKRLREQKPFRPEDAGLSPKEFEAALEEYEQRERARWMKEWPEYRPPKAVPMGPPEG